MSEIGYMLDASALLALMQGEIGADRIEAILENARISTVNLAEVAAKLNDYGMPDAEVSELVTRLDLKVVAFDQAQALRSGALRPITRSFGLSLGDRACLAAADLTGTIAVTSDRAWLKIAPTIPVELFR
jgi:ribonuclease VapC